MLFNSISFAIFLPIVFLLHWFVAGKNRKFQNALLLLASYVFYASWDWRFLFLLGFSTALDFYAGIRIFEASTKRRKMIWLCVSVIVNLGFLGFFKYYNFFSVSFSEAISRIGIHADPVTLNLILPVGISFYTFHGLSYVFDLYHDKVKPERNFIDYAVFVGFFPLLVAGPIERATHLLPQFKITRSFQASKAVDGLRQILWGLFKKIVIADSCAVYSNLIFNNYSEYNGSTLLLGAIFFAFQIYGDFSGYSDIALGTAKLFGIDLIRNFAYPYFSRDIAEFWRRWNISLTTWFRDYLYIPLGGSKRGRWLAIRNTFIIFIVSGFWHGANWTFIAWGILNALFFLPLLLLHKNRENLEIVAQGRLFPTRKEFLQILFTFCLTVIAWVFFRSSSVGDGFAYTSKIFSFSLFSLPEFQGKGKAVFTLFLVVICFSIEWIGREKQHALESLGLQWTKPLRWIMYYCILSLVIYYFQGIGEQFIYFQF